MKGKSAIAHLKFVVNDLYGWLNRFAFGRGLSLIGAIKILPMVFLTSIK